MLRDPTHQEHFARHGWILLPGFLEAHATAALRDFIAHANARAPDIAALFSTLHAHDEGFKRESTARIREATAAAFARCLRPDHEILVGSFLQKRGADGDPIPLHQDWTLVDETRARTASLWIPLEPITDRSGGLLVVPGSHRLFPQLRSTTTRAYLPALEPLMARFAVPVAVRPGDAILFDHALVHGSAANRTTAPRYVATACVAPRQEPLWLVHRDWRSDSDELEVWTQPRDFLLRFADFFRDIQERPKLGSLTETCRETAGVPTEAALLDALEAARDAFERSAAGLP